LALGAAELLLVAMLMARPEAVAVLRLALIPLLFLNLLALVLLVADLRTTLSRAHGAGSVAIFGGATILAGVLVPLGLLALDAPRLLPGAVLLILLGTFAVRYEVMRLPHLLAEPSLGRTARVSP
jgi:hypothetical protein